MRLGGFVAMLDPDARAALLGLESDSGPKPKAWGTPKMIWRSLVVSLTDTLKRLARSSRLTRPVAIRAIGATATWDSLLAWQAALEVRGNLNGKYSRFPVVAATRWRQVTGCPVRRSALRAGV